MPFIGFVDRSDKSSTRNYTSKVFLLALVLLLSVQILISKGRPLVQLPCPLPQLGHAENYPPASPIPPPVVPPSPETRKELPLNSFFSEADSDIWYCKQHHVDELRMSYSDWLAGNFTDEEALCAAHRQSKRPMAEGTPRIAFLFLTQGNIAVEPLWRKFFGGNEDKYSVYVHATNRNFQFAQDSIFYNRTIPSKPLKRFEISLPEAVRRLLSYALLDSTVPNAWFHVSCESSIPIRGFPYVYEYLTNSQHSFVEAFYPTSSWWRTNWNATGDMAIPEQFMRKGEAWVTVHRRHAGLIVGDHYVFPKFKHHWYLWGISSEIYIPTLISMVDPLAIANHSLVYVNWRHLQSGGHPMLYNHTNVSPGLIQGVQSLTRNVDGFFNSDGKWWGDETEKSCVYNGIPNSTCFLFARKFTGHPLDIELLMKLSPVLGYR